MTTTYWSDFVPNSTFYRILSGFHRTFATGVACRQGTLTPPDTWSCPFGTCICSTCWDQSFSELVVILPDYALRISIGTFSILLEVITIFCPLLQKWLQQNLLQPLNRNACTTFSVQSNRLELCNRVVFVYRQFLTKIVMVHQNHYAGFQLLTDFFFLRDTMSSKTNWETQQYASKKDEKHRIGNVKVKWKHCWARDTWCLEQFCVLISFTLSDAFKITGVRPLSRDSLSNIPRIKMDRKWNRRNRHLRLCLPKIVLWTTLGN